MRGTILRPWQLLTLAVPLALCSGCGEQPEPVGRLGAGAGEIHLGYPGVANLELNWDMSRELTGREGAPVVFLHLLDQNKDILRTFDHALPGPWKPGDEQSYEVTIQQSALAPPLDDGTYRLTAGLYDRAGHRWPLESAGPVVGANEYEVAKVVVGEYGGPMPQFFFSSTWLGVEGGTDLQTLGRRWLTEDGVIRLGGVVGSGELRMALGVPEGGGALEGPVFDAGASQQSVMVTSTCGGAAVQVSGPGSHSIALPVALAAVPEETDGRAGHECEVSFSANYHFSTREGDERRTVALEGLSWLGQH